MQRSGRAILAVLAFFLTSFLGRMVEAQEEVLSVPLTNGQAKLERLAPDKTSGESTFLVDTAQLVSFQVTATTDINVTIETPSGEILSGDNIDTVDGTFTNFETQEGDNSMLFLTVGFGFHYIFEFPSQGVGQYTVRFDAGPSLDEEVAVSSLVLTDGPVKTALIVARPSLELGDLQVLSAFVLEGSAPVVGATVSVRVRLESDVVEILQLIDNGIDGDYTAGDGIYSAITMPSESGQYSMVASIDGMTSDGTPFSRKNAAEFSVFLPKSRIVRLVGDRAVDDDDDGIFNRVAVRIETDTAEPGHYEIYLKLRSDSGKTVIRKSELDLVEGLQLHTIDIEGEAIIGLDENGPFDIALLRMDYVDQTETFVVDSLDDRIQTRPYLLTQFEFSVPGSIAGTVADEQSGDGLANVVVMVHDVNGDFYRNATTDDSGQYKLEDIAPGNYFLSTQNSFGFIDEIYQNLPCTGSCNSPDEEGTPVEVAPSSVTTSIDFVLSQ